MKRRLFTLLLAGTMVLSLAACGSKSSDASKETTAAVTETEAATTEEATEEATEEETTAAAALGASDLLTFGETVTTSDGLFEVTPGFGGFAKEVGNFPDANFMTPDGQPSGGNPYSAADGMVMMYFDADIEYVGTATDAADFEYDFTVTYNDEDAYEFQGGNAYNNGAGYHTGCGDVASSEDIQTGDWTYEYKFTFDPASDNTSRYVRFCVEVPEEIETSTDKNLTLTLTVNGEDFTFNCR